MNKFKDVRERAFSLTLRIIKMCNTLPKSEANKIITNQLIRSTSSIGANLEEAAGAHTKSDFSYCLNISKKESREGFYWLRLLYESNADSIKKKMTSLLNEYEEVVKILVVSSKNANSKLKPVKS